MNDKEAYKRAKKQVEELKDFYQHLVIYLIINGAILLVGLASGAGWWVLILPFLWGIGLAAHAMEALPIATGWEERKIRELMAKERGDHKPKNDYSYYEDDEA